MQALPSSALRIIDSFADRSRPSLHLSITLALALVAGLTGCHPANAAGPSGATKQVEIRDPNFNNMVAYTLTIPANWNFQGAVMTGPGCDFDQSIVAYRVWSDDLRYGVQRMPTVSWYTVQDARTVLGPKCKKMAAMGADEYGKMVSPIVRPGSKVISVTTAPQAPSLAENAKQLEASIGANADRLGMPHAKYSSDAKELRIEFMMGKDPEEEFLQVMEQISETPSSTIVSRPGQVLKTQWMMTHKTDAWIVSERAPKGQLDSARLQLEAIRTSLKENPEWDQKVAAWMKNRSDAAIRQSWAITNASLKASQQQHDAMMKRGQEFNDNMRAQGDKRNAEFRQQQAAKSAHTADEVDYILDQQYYVNPASGQTSTISTTYTNNWQNGTGQQVLTNIQGYDPNGQVAGNWTQLQPIKH
jgi:hypothetical protein